jgi:hypothetical protein
MSSRPNPGAIGRPSMIYDEERLGWLLRLVRQGTPKRVAARRVGIAESTFDHWMIYGSTAERKLEEGLTVEPWEERFRKFRQDVLTAIATFEEEAVNAAMAIALETRKPSVILEILRRHPDTRARWNVPTQLEVLGEEDGTGPASMSEAELEDRIAKLEAIATDREEEGIEA